MTPKIGFIGLGIMGSEMSQHLLKAGYDLVVHDVVPQAMAALVQVGATAAQSCKEVAAESDIIISMVPDSPQVEQVALADDGIIAGCRPGQIYIDMSTIAPQTSIRVAKILGEKGVRSLDAPVSGGQAGAQNATLSIMVGGSEDLYREVLPVLEVMGSTITHCGDNGAGQTVKACNQIQVALNFLGMAEALVLGAKAGVDPAVVLRVLSGGAAQTRVVDLRGAKVIAGDFEPGFKARFHYKDLNIVMATARELGVPLPTTATAHELFTALMARGGGDLDHSAIITVLEDLAGVQARSPKQA